MVGRLTLNYILNGMSGIVNYCGLQGAQKGFWHVIIGKRKKKVEEIDKLGESDIPVLVDNGHIIHIARV